MTLSRLSISNKLRLGMGATMLLVALLGAGALLVIRDMSQRSEDIQRNWMPSVLAVSALSTSLLEMRRNELAFLARTDPGERARAEERFGQNLARVNANLQAYRPLVSHPEEKRIFPGVEQGLQAYLAHHRQLREAFRANDAVRASAVLDEARPGMDRLIQDLEALTQLNGREATATADAASESARLGIYALSATLLVALGLGLVVAMLLSRSISGRLLNLSEALGRLARRDYGFVLKETADKDEIGQMARALDTCRDGLKEADRLAEAAAAEARVQTERGARVDALVRGFEAEAGEALGTVSSAATQLSATAVALSETAGEGTRQATALASAAGQTSSNVQTVAASSEELASSIAEVARQVRHTAAITERASEAARETDGTVRGLAEAAAKIGDVVRLISDIAGQTNLLALNATIEAARAGDAGKGFAVVASEVKNLAGQTARATEQISQQIAAMQAETTRTVEAIAGIGRTIEELNETTAQVAAASEEQAAATLEIGRAVAEAAQGAEEASRGAAGMMEGAERTGGSARDVQGASTELAQQSERLRLQVGSFLQNIRAA
ncbi:methyl-accepting chemotaxis protein [Sediminicoccus sp. BL-A-41-H5]|uniref:methyl-accepting chemotaxis protein n=1 Tax=Sediminicoccus sp. BL-A-41-H5 TaxID=3421106 RepID=UPI003D67E49D